MRKLLLTTAAVAAAIAWAGCGNGDSNTFTDKRDGQKYRTVVIGGMRWMAQNLNYKTDSSWCYENNADSCKKYGRLYTWETALTICPAGYHLPSCEEWDTLCVTVGGMRRMYHHDVLDEILAHWIGAGKTLKSKSGWNNRDDDGNNGNGTDDFGFSALPSGDRYPSDFWRDHFFGVGYYGVWWTVDEDNTGNAYYRYMNTDDHMGELDADKNSGYSVRCVADIP